MATIKEIAEQLDLSLSTVSIVLRGKARERHISLQTEALVMETAREMGYQPNLSARQLRGQSQTLFIALYLSDDFRTPMMLRFLSGLQQQMQSLANFELVVRLYHPGHLAEAVGPEIMQLFHAAIICNAAEEDLRALDVNPPRIPVVLYNRSSPVFPSVEFDSEAIGRIPAEVFSSHGRRKAVYLSSEANYPYLRVRQDAFLKTAHALGLEAEVMIQPNTMAGGAAAGAIIAAMADRPDCLAAASDRLALGALHSLQHIAIPQALELISVGNGDVEMAQYATPALSVVELPMEEMARRCFALLQECLAGRRPASETLAVRYLPRESCGA